MHFNSRRISHCTGEYYAQDFGTGNLELLARFFEKYPQYADKTFLSVKVPIFISNPRHKMDT